MNSLTWKEPSLLTLTRQDKPPLSYWFFDYGRAFLTWFLLIHFILTFGQWLIGGQINYGRGIIIGAVGAGFIGILLKLITESASRKIRITDHQIVIHDPQGIKVLKREKILSGKISEEQLLDRTTRFLELTTKEGEVIGMMIADDIPTSALQSVFQGILTIESIETI